MAELDLTTLLGEHASTSGVPGAALGVLRDGVVTSAYWGVADTRTGEPVTPETRFAVGSLVKPMTATVIVRLAAAGRLSLDDPVAARVPELRDSTWAAGVTVRDLLANRSRLPLRAELEFQTFAGDDDEVLSRFAAAVATGERTPRVWSYTNAGWCLLGRAIEAMTGLSWEDAMRADLLDPFGLEQATFAGSPAVEPRASGHNVTADGAVAVEPWSPRSLGPAGSTLLATVPDLLRFAEAHLHDPALAALRAPQEDVRIHGWLDGWCLGWAQFDWEGGPVCGWDGLISGQRGVLRLLPEHRGAVVLLTNGSTGRVTYRSLFGRLMQELFEIGLPPLRLEPSAGTTDLSRYAGVYAWPDRRWTATPSRAGLLLEGDGRTIEARPIDDRVFLVDAADPDNPTVTFGAFDAEGRPGALYVMLWALPRT